jgi:hypothetical protein
MDPAVSRAAFLMALIVLGTIAVFVVGSTGLDRVLMNPVIFVPGFLAFVFWILVKYYQATSPRGPKRR